MLVGPCVCGVHSVLLEGSFAYPDPLRFARAALEHKVTLFKTGSWRALQKAAAGVCSAPRAEPETAKNHAKEEQKNPAQKAAKNHAN